MDEVEPAKTNKANILTHRTWWAVNRSSSRPMDWRSPLARKSSFVMFSLSCRNNSSPTPRWIQRLSPFSVFTSLREDSRTLADVPTRLHLGHSAFQVVVPPLPFGVLRVHHGAVCGVAVAVLRPGSPLPFGVLRVHHLAPMLGMRMSIRLSPLPFGVLRVHHAGKRA